ncbi:uncharacterized protein BDV17DRAFT_254828 [Aspergillus undulatus]|uniref:uncharacterized protein n=1 Tax=Aspergillus undulatus TaxID=1810928 RepID=UPI003CCD9BDC
MSRTMRACVRDTCAVAQMACCVSVASAYRTEPSVLRHSAKEARPAVTNPTLTACPVYYGRHTLYDQSGSCPNS